MRIVVSIKKAVMFLFAQTVGGSQPVGKPNGLNLIVVGLAGVAVHVAARLQGSVVQAVAVAGSQLLGRESGYR